MLKTLATYPETTKTAVIKSARFNNRLIVLTSTYNKRHRRFVNVPPA